MTKGNGVALPLMFDRKGMDKIALWLIRIQLHDVSLARRRANGNHVRILLRPVKGSVVGQLVADQ